MTSSTSTSKAAVIEAMTGAREALVAADQITWAQRQEFLAQLATVLSESAPTLERTLANDTDKLRPDAAAEVRVAIDACVFYARNAQHWPLATGQPPGLVVAQTPLGNPLWRLTRLLLPVLLDGGVVVVTRPRRSADTVTLLARAVDSAGFPSGTVSVLADEPRPQTDVRTRRATYNYGTHPNDSPKGRWESMVVAPTDDLPTIVRRAVRRAGAPNSPVLPTTVRLVATPPIYRQLCREVAKATAQTPSTVWRTSTTDAPATATATPTVLVDIAFDIDSALDLAHDTAFGLGPLLWSGVSNDLPHEPRHRPWQISEIWSAANPVAEPVQRR